MNLLFAGTIPAWQLILLFAALCAFTFWTYGASRLRRPWNRILPVCRCVAFGLLILILFQPVLGRSFQTTVRGRIPIIIDNSGSMSVRDRLSPPAQIELAWQFHLFPRELRDLSYRNLQNPIDDLRLALREQATQPAAKIRELRKSCQAIHDKVNNHPQPVADHDELVANLTGCCDALDKVLADPERDQETNLQKATALLGDARQLLTRFQADADRRLAAAANPEVDAALAEIQQRTRIQWVEELLYGKVPALVPNLSAHGPVDLYFLDDPATPRARNDLAEAAANLPATRLGTVIDRVLAQYEDQPLSAMILLSDGNVNSGKPITAVREQLAARGVTLHTVGIGSTEPPKDLAIERIIVPESAFKEDTLSLSALVRRPGYENLAIKVTVFADDEVVASAEMPPDGTPAATVPLSFKPDHVGPTMFSVRLSPLADEAVAENNLKEFTVNILEDPIRILFLDEFPRWETRYAALALQRDQRVELTATFADVLATQPDESRDTLLPADRDGLFAYDVVMLGDVNPHHFSAAQLEDLRAFVTERGGTLVLLAGEHHMPNNYRATPLNEVLPFRDSQRPGSATLNDRGMVEINLDLRETFSRDALVQIGRSPDDSRQLWRRLPGMIWVKSALAPAAVADELVHTTPQDWPVILTSSPGSGKVLYLGSDSFWRWRYRAKWTYHQRLWSQILLWATRGRTTGSDPFVKLMTDRSAYAPGESVQLKARVFDKQARPLNDGTVAAEVYDADNRLVRSVPFAYLENSGGEYRAQLRDLPRGNYRIEPRVGELTDVEIDAAWEIEVRDLPTSEYVNLARDAATLQQLGDHYYDLANAAAIANNVSPVTLEETHRADLEIWNSFWLLALVAAILGFEWQMRKSNRLV